MNEKDLEHAETIQCAERKKQYIEYVTKDRAKYETKYDLGDYVKFYHIVYVNGEGFGADRYAFISGKKIEVENKKVVAYYQVVQYFFNDMRFEKFKNDPGWLKESALELLPYSD